MANKKAMIKLDYSFYCGIVKVWPTDSKLLVKLLAAFRLFTETSKFLAIDHKVSPVFTV